MPPFTILNSFHFISFCFPQRTEYDSRVHDVQVEANTRLEMEVCNQSINSKSIVIDNELSSFLASQLLQRAQSVADEKVREVNKLSTELTQSKAQCKMLEVSFPNNPDSSTITNSFMSSCHVSCLLQSDIAHLNTTLRSTLDRLKDSRLIDRQLVTSLMVTYITRSDQRSDVLSVMSKILDWDEHTKQKVSGVETRWRNWRNWKGGKDMKADCVVFSSLL